MKGLKMTGPLMPKATAVWLVENTTLSFQQIADFCEMHPLEIQAIADGEVAGNIVGYNPITNGQLTAEEIKRCEADEKAVLQLYQNAEIAKFLQKGNRYVSSSKRIDTPSAIAWFVKNHPTVPDSAIIKLLRTTKATITAIRERTHKNIQNIIPKNPVTLGLCSEGDLEKIIAIAEFKKGDDK